MNSKKIKAVNLFIIVAVIEMVGITGFVGFKVFGLSKNIRKLNDENVVLHQKIESANTIESLKSDLATTNDNFAKTTAFFFDDNSLLAFLKALSNNASKYGISVNSVSFGNIGIALDANPPIKTLPVTLQISSSYDGLDNFLKYLETFNKYIIENSVSFTSGEKANTSVSITFYVITQSTDRWTYTGEVP
ncbi:MAG: hypothetical protein ACPLZB_05835 [Caldisericaceae bacterium]